MTYSACARLCSAAYQFATAVPATIDFLLRTFGQSVQAVQSFSFELQLGEPMEDTCVHQKHGSDSQGC